MTSNDLATAPPARRRRRSSGKVTIADVARVAGMSMHTVSRVLNTPDQVPPRTVALIRDAIMRTGYVPNLLAGGLASGRSRLVAVLVPDIGVPTFLETLQALGDTLGRHGYQMMLGESGYDAEDEPATMQSIIGRRPDGIVLTRLVRSPQARSQLRAAGIPVVESWDTSDDPVDMLIGFSHEAVGATVADFLHSTGRRRPGLALGDDPRARRRREAFIQAGQRAGWLSPDRVPPTYEVRAPASLGDGRRALAAMLVADPQLDCMFCSTDLIALGVLIEAAHRGIRVPEELAVVGFGDLALTADVQPALTTVRIDGSAIGSWAARAIIDRVEGRSQGGAIADIGFSLIRRASA